MKNIFNLFKKKQEPQVISTQNHYNSELMTYTINNKEYAIADSQLIKIQAVAEDVQIYGWSLEVRWKNNNGEFYNWSTYWNHRIYVSRSSALDAATKVFPSYNNGYEWRIVPLYKMTEPQFRDYKIDQLLKPEVNKNTKVYDIKAWKLKEDCEINYEKTNKTFKYSKDTLFIQMEDGQIRTIKDQTSGINFHDRFQLFNDLLKNEQVEEVDIRNEKWVHPHLCKELKTKIKL
jgi:hypothetical protein